MGAGMEILLQNTNNCFPSSVCYLVKIYLNKSRLLQWIEIFENKI